MSVQTMPIQTITVHMNEEYSCENKKYIGSYGEYYQFNGVNYDIHFPICWVFQYPNADVIDFGPETCYHCFKNGYYNGVFIGYCDKCARIANYERGNGMIGYGVERGGHGLLDENSIWNVYLQNTILEEIGDRTLFIDYNYKISYPNYYYKVGEITNDDDTVHYDEFTYNIDDEDDITIPFPYEYLDDVNYDEEEEEENEDGSIS